MFLGGFSVMYCTDCGKENSDNAQFCINCGSKLNNTEQPVLRYCSHCGNENPNNSIYCQECGQELEKTSNSDDEILQEMIHVAPAKAISADRKILYFTDQNIYIGEGSLMVGSGFALGGLSGHLIEKKMLSDKEKKARSMNFREKAAQDPEIIVIPYQNIINLNMGKKKMFLAPKIRIETTSKDYEFYISQTKKYKGYIKTIPTILGDKVTIE